MPKPSKRFVCQECGAIAPRWTGRCAECGAWNSVLEETAAPSLPGAAVRAAGTVQPITEVAMEEWRRSSTGSGELDRVLGGGLAPGAIVLVGGDPGIGKSTLLLQCAAHLARGGARALYVTAEESAQQVRHRADRLGALAPELLLGAETNILQIEAWAREMRPAFLVVDSIQTVVDPEAGPAAGTVGQVRACCARLSALARDLPCAVLIVGHVTKEGLLAGPRVLEHMVDCVLYFEGDRFHSFRVLRAVKNRFGSTDEIGVWEMRQEGLTEVPSPSELFLGEEAGGATASGSFIAALLEGSRPILVEIQALVARSYLASPRRTTTGVDSNRAAMIFAVLERRCGLRLGDQDIFVNVAGGLRVSEPAADLPIALALASSCRDRPSPRGVVAVGEVGLGGELRAVSGLERRLREAARLGFRQAIVPAGGKLKVPGIDAVHCSSLREALEAAASPPSLTDPIEMDAPI